MSPNIYIDDVSEEIQDYLKDELDGDIEDVEIYVYETVSNSLYEFVAGECQGPASGKRFFYLICETGTDNVIMEYLDDVCFSFPYDFQDDPDHNWSYELQEMEFISDDPEPGYFTLEVTAERCGDSDGADDYENELADTWDDNIGHETLVFVESEPPELVLD